MSDLPDDPGTDGPAPEDRDLQAAEYVIGALPPAQARALEALAMSDASVAASVAAWEGRLAPLADLVPPLAPPAMLWRRLALATGIESVIQAAPPRRSAAGRVWRSPGLWRAMTVGSMAVAASLAFLLYAGKPEPLTAVLSPGSAPGGTFLVRVGPDGAATVVALGDISVPQGRALELWAVTAGGSVPVSMGLLPPAGRARFHIPLPAGTQLLVSQEQAGGSPTKQPTSTPIFAGRLTGI